MQISKGNARAVIKFDRDWGEYVVKFYLNNKRLKDADYFTDERDDAIGTANAELDRMIRLEIA